MSTPAGWFPNPANPNEEVYWDGDRWSGDVRPVFAAAPPEHSVDGESTTGAEAGEPLPPSTEEVPPSAKRKRTVLWVSLAAVLVVLIAGGVTTAVVMNNIHTQQVAEQKAAAAEKKAEAKRAAEAEAEAAAAAKEAADDAERTQRTNTVVQVEASIKKMAEGDIAQGILEGPVIGVKCNPVSGSTDDLTDPTTTFDCFVSNKDNGDGTQSGYFFNATVNWTSGEYTYGLGKSGS